MDAPITITLTSDQLSLLLDALEARRRACGGEGPVSAKLQDERVKTALARIDAIEDILAEAAAGNAPRPSSRLGLLWVVFAPGATWSKVDVLWSCTVHELRLHAKGGGENPEAVFTDKAEASLFAQKLLVERAHQLHAMAAALEARP